MTSSNNEQTSLTALAQFKAALRNNFDFSILENIVEQEININCQIPDTDHIRNHEPEIIGSTLLHLARGKSNFGIFEFLVDHGIDFTMKNKNGSTALLQPIENIFGNSNTSVLKTVTETLNNESTELILSMHVARKITANPRNKHAISHFHVACMLGNIAAMEFFLQNQAALVDEPINANSPILPGYSPLHLAVMSSSLQSVETLLKRGANISVKNSRGKTPLHLLIERKAVLVEWKGWEARHNSKKVNLLKSIDEKIRLLLQNHTTFIIDDTGLSRLHTACVMPCTPMLRQFVAAMENVELAIRSDSPFFSGYTALHFAILFESPVARLLLQKGADITARDALGVTPFDVLLWRNDIEGMHLALSIAPSLRHILLSDGRTRLSDLIIAMEDGSTFASLVRDRRFDVSARVPSDSPLFPLWGALHLAVMLHKPCDDFRTLQLCLNAPANLLARDSRGSTPLHLAFRRQRVQMVNFLLERDIRANVIDDDGLSILHIAVAAKDARLVEKLLPTITAADIDNPVRSSFEWFDNRQDLEEDPLVIDSGATLLHIAVTTENLEMVRLLLKNGANVYATDVHGLTPIHRVLVADADKKVGDLLFSELFSDATLQDRAAPGANLTHLHVACFLNNVAAVERFLKSGSDVEAAVSSPLPFLAHLEGFTPTHVAMREENVEVLRFLLDYGADVLAKLPDGSTPFYRNLINRPRFFLRFFREELRKRGEVLRRIEDDIGLTMLHVASYELDLELVSDSLHRGVNVNARVSLKSPIWPDCTPLYVLVARCKNINGSYGSSIIDILGLLLEHGADVSTMDVRGDSALHLADEMVADTEASNLHLLPIITTVVAEMLSHIRDFTANPRSKRGISQFHVACRICDVNTMKKFLNEKRCTISERIDYLFDDRFDACTPLHLSMSCHVDDARQIEAVELLLKYGADCHATNAFGDALVHTAARCIDGPLRLDLLQRLVDEGADLKARNFAGETSFELVLKSQNISAEEITFFLGSGLRANTFNSITELGYLAHAIRKQCYDSKEQVLNILLNNCNIRETDKGRTGIHNVVSTQRYTSSKEYVTLIHKLISLGCDLDCQDDEGRTALHSAVQFDNCQAVQALLISGIDVNILDADNLPATSYTTAASISLSSVAFHVSKLRHLNLDVIQQGVNFHRRFDIENPTNKRRMLRFSAEITNTELMYIGSASIPLRGFLSDTGIVAAYPSIPTIEREEIDHFFESDPNFLNNQLPELQGLLRSQYRKALRRCEIIDPAIKSLQILFIKIKGLNVDEDFTRCFFSETCSRLAFEPSTMLPRRCSENILRYLTNREIDNLIGSTGKFAM